MDSNNTTQELESFMNQYEVATNSHDFDQVEPLVSVNASYLFTDGTFIGLQEIRKAFEDTWRKIQNEVYKIEEVHWLAVGDTIASCMYDFQWKGTIDGEEKSGKGRGTNIVIKRDGQWLMVHEHLSK